MFILNNRVENNICMYVRMSGYMWPPVVCDDGFVSSADYSQCVCPSGIMFFLFLFFQVLVII